MLKSFLTLLVVAVISAGAAFEEGSGYEVGDTATDFELKGVDGKTVSLADYDNAKGFIVVFTCNTCPYAKLYEDRLIELDKKYAEKGFPVIAINPNDSEKSPGDSFAEMKKRAKEKGFTFPYLLDETQNTTAAYGATKTPHVYVLKKSAEKYKVAYIGAIDNNHKDASLADQKYVENAVDQLLNKQEVDVKSTKAIGCTIKWKTT